MEAEKSDNAAFYPNSSAVPREIDKAAGAPNDSSIESAGHHVDLCSSSMDMDRNQNAILNEIASDNADNNKRCLSELADHSNHSQIKSPPVEHPKESSSTKSCLIETESVSDNTENFVVQLRPDTNEANKNDQSNDRVSKQEVNGFISEPTIMSNGTKLKRSDDQLNETSLKESNSTKKICNNNTKTTPVNNFFVANSCTNSKPGSSSNSADSSSSVVKEPIKNGDSLSDDNTETESNSDRFDSDDDLTEEENTWDCSVCTYRNSSDAYKCTMCDVRKNFSSRKPRINPKLLVQQVAKQQQQIQQEALRASALQKSSSSKSVEKCSSNKDRSKANSNSLTNSAEKRKTVDLEPMSPTSSTSSSKSVKREKKEKKESASPHKEENGLDAKSTSFAFRLKDVDRNNGVTKSITVGNVTVKITEFQLKRPESEPLKKNGKKSTPNKSKFPGS